MSTPKGQVFITSYALADRIPPHVSLNLQVVHSAQKGIKAGFIQVPQLAPSQALFQKALYRWKKLRFTAEERKQMEAGPTGTWFDLYAPAFETELQTRPDSRRVFARLKEKLDEGTSVALICYCEDESRCHRLILGQQLIAAGYDVVFIH